MFCQYIIVADKVYYALQLIETLLLTLPLPMLTFFLLRSCGKIIKKSKLFYTVLTLWGILIVILISSIFIEGFFYVIPDNQYHRGLLYPILLLPAIMILLINLMEAIRYRKTLSRKVFIGLLIAILPSAVTLIIHLFIDVSTLVYIGYILSALAMYIIILSNQIEQDRRQQEEIIKQQQKIADQQREIAHERASVMVLQMRPHFIYNTLMSIYSLCRLDPMKARQVTMDPYHDPLHISIRTEHTDLITKLIVKDDGCGFNSFDKLSKNNEPSIALNNIRQRLDMMCNGSLTITSGNDGGTVVTVRLPNSTT